MAGEAAAATVSLAPAVLEETAAATAAIRRRAAPLAPPHLFSTTYIYSPGRGWEA